MSPLSVAMVGGVPSCLGGGGLELQMHRTGEALGRLGHRAFMTSSKEAEAGFDVLHAFGSEGDVQHLVGHWRGRVGVPLIISPVLVAPPRAEVRLAMRARAGRVVGRHSSRDRLLMRADALVALTRHEAGLLRVLAPATAISVVGNGVDPARAGTHPVEIEPGYLIQVGSVTRRKRQVETLRRLAPRGDRHVIVGPVDPQEESALLSAVADTRAVWVGDAPDEQRVRSLIRNARAMLHFSRAEGQSLAILEALAEGVPVLCSPLACNVELADEYPDLVRLCKTARDVDAALQDLPSPGTAAPVPSWDDVAASLLDVYRDALARVGRRKGP